jgi:hypothetical protein
VPDHALEPSCSFSNQLQKVAEKGMPLTLMWCGCGSERRGMPDNRVSHSEGGCGDSRNQVKKCGGRPTAIRTGEEKEKWSRKRLCVG